MSVLLDETTVVVPDSIDVQVGFKYMTMGDDGRLYSPHCNSHMAWVPGEKHTAICVEPTPWSWVAVRGNGYDPTPQRDAHRLLERKYAASSTVPSSPPGRRIMCDEKPQTALPAGMNWSWVKGEKHPAVDEDCGCGIYCGPRDIAEKYRRASNAVLVEIALWGKVIEGENGSRGQYAYPQRIIANHANTRLAAKAAALYSVPLEVEAAASEAAASEAAALYWVPRQGRWHRLVPLVGYSVAVGAQLVAVFIVEPMGAVNVAAAAGIAFLAGRNLR